MPAKPSSFRGHGTGRRPRPYIEISERRMGDNPSIAAMGFHPSYPFTPPAVRPPTIHFWQ